MIRKIISYILTLSLNLLRYCKAWLQEHILVNHDIKIFFMCQFYDIDQRSNVRRKRQSCRKRKAGSKKTKHKINSRSKKNKS